MPRCSRFALSARLQQRSDGAIGQGKLHNGGGTIFASVLGIWTRAFMVTLGNAVYLTSYALGRDRIGVDAV